jgi:hypothetical protein
MKEGGKANIDLTMEKGSRGDNYDLTCSGGKITIEPVSSVGP